MANTTGLLESAFAEALQDASDTEIMVLGRLPDDLPDDFPDNESDALNKCLEVYRANQAAIDASFRGAAGFLGTPDGEVRLRAMQSAFADGESTAFGRSMAQDILANRSFDEMRSEVTSRDYAAAGIGVAGSAVFPIYSLVGLGVGIGVEHMYVGEPDVRFWVDGEVQYLSAFTFGLSLSVWEYTPLKGLMFGVVFEIPFPQLGPYVARFMLYWQREQATKKFKLFGWDTQLGVGKVTPLLAAGGIFVGFQIAKKRREARVELSVLNAQTGTNTITVAKSTTLDVKITAGADLTFNTGAEVKLNMPNFFTSDEVAAMTVSGAPGYWDVSIDGQDFVFTANQSYTWYAGMSVSFKLENAESAAEESGTLPGVVTLSGNPTTKVPIGATADLYVAPVVYSATITWTATQGTGTDDLTLDSSCTGGCTGGPITVTSTGGNTVSQLVTATDQYGDTWQLGYQFNYEGDAAEIRAVIYNPDNSAVVIPNSGTWYPYGGILGTSTAQYTGTAGYTTFSITVTAWPSTT